jgi:hypothetical protein
MGLIDWTRRAFGGAVEKSNAGFPTQGLLPSLGGVASATGLSISPVSTWAFQPLMPV